MTTSRKTKKVATKATKAINMKAWLSTTTIAAGLIAMPHAALAENWADHTVDSGSISVDTSIANTTNITQNTEMVKVHGDGNISADWTVNVAQPGSSSKYVLYDVKGDATVILGKLNANGEIYIFNQDGVIFGQGSVVNVGAIVASTGFATDSDIADNDGKLTFKDVDTGGKIVLDGSISVGDAGLAAFVAPTVINNGVITAKMGTVALASGNKVTLDLYGDGLIEIATADASTDGLIENKGTISAAGGKVVMSAETAKAAVDNVVNMEGVVDVSSVEVKGGKIILSGGSQGKVKVSGKVLAAGKNGGGEIKVKGHDIEATDTSIFLADAFETGDGGTFSLLADNDGIFEGSVYARGGSLSGNGGAVEISAKGQLGYDGSVDTTAINGEAGSLLFDPLFAIIHSGSLHNPIGLQYILSAEALADDLARNGSLTVQADNYIDVGTDAFGLGSGPINLANYNYDTLNTHGSPFFWNWTYDNHSGITSGNIVLQSNTVNFNKDLTIGSGSLNVQATTVNMNGKLYGYNPAKDTVALLTDSRLIGAGTISTINVLSASALINQALGLSDDDTALTTINVGNGTYTENVNVNKSNVKLQSKNGRGVTTINGTAGVGALGTVVIAGGVHDVQLGDTNKGFTINGFDSASAGIENAAVYLDDNHNNLTIKGNEIVAKGDEALSAEYGMTNSNITIDGNIFSGKTYTGAYGAWGLGDQFTVSNVPRQLVALNLGLSNLTFTNNVITGDAGDRQLVAIESTTANISDNKFDGLSTAAALRVRGSNVNVHNNTIDGNGLGIGIESDTRTSDLTVEANTINNTGADGISIANATGITTIKNNEIGLLGVTDNIGAVLGGDAIFIYNTDGAVISDNKTKNTKYNNSGPEVKGSGVTVSNSDNVVVKNNTIKNAGNDGITVRKDGGSADNVDVLGNHIDTTSRVGIYLEETTNTEIRDNDVTNNGRYAAIYLAGGGNFWVTGNDIDHVAEVGILAQNTGGAFTIIDNNSIDFTGESKKSSDGTNSGDGIQAVNATGLVVTNNKIGLNGAISGDGIFIDPSNGAYIATNKIKNVSDNGIYSLNNSDVTIQQNEITNAGLNGILVEGGNNIIVGGPSNGFANVINSTGADGIHLVNATNANINHNKIGLLGGAHNINGDGIFVQNSDGVNVIGNTVKDTYSTTSAKGSGINVLDSDYATIDGNTVSNSSWDNIRVATDIGTADHDKMINNIVDHADRIGVYSAHATNLLIDNNTVDHATATVGIPYGAIASDWGSDITVSNNTVTNSTDGILMYQVGGKNKISGNKINNVSVDGIHVTETQNLKISNNEIGLLGSVGNDGIYANGLNSASGKNIDGIDQVGVYGNKINNVSGNGVNLVNAQGSQANGTVDIANNTITAAGKNGILIDGGTFASVYLNTIKRAALSGVEVYNSFKDFISFNDIDGETVTTDSGIRIDNTDNVTANNNTIKNTKIDGIRAFDSDFLTANTNIISDVAGSGIGLAGDNDGSFSDNTITNAGRGFWVGNSDRTKIIHNTITNSATNGIFLTNYLGASDDTVIQKNTISGGQNGIYVEGGASNTKIGGTVLADGNTISGVSVDGIYATNAATLFAGYNTIDGTGRNGVSIIDSSGVTINQNMISNTAGNGVFVDPSPSTIVTNNTINSAAANGVYILSSDGSVVQYNTINNSGLSGVLVENSSNVKVGGTTSGLGNTIGGTVAGWQHNGVTVKGGADNLVQNNTINNAGSNGIVSDGSSSIDILNNTVNGAVNSGIQFYHSDNAQINDNTVKGADYGISGETSSFVTVLRNKIGTSATRMLRDGINFWYGVSDSTVAGNTIFATGDGISLGNAGGQYNDRNTIGGTASADKNTIDGGRNGIIIDGGASEKVLGNVITNASQDGIIVKGLTGTNVISKNSVKNSGDDGIDVDGVTGSITITSNTVDATGLNAANDEDQNGIEVSGTTGALIDSNIVKSAAWDGINLQQSSGATISNNQIYNTLGASGIGAYNGISNTTIDNNVITKAKQFGMWLGSGSTGTLTVTNNDISEITQSDGIYVNGNSGTIKINSNDIYNVGRDGISANGDIDEVNSNRVLKTGRDGILVTNSAYVDIKSNKVGVTISGPKMKKTNGSLISDLTATATGNNIGADGIHVENSGYADIISNTVSNTVNDGIFLDPSDYSVIAKNTISTTGGDGIESADNSYVTIGGTTAADGNTISGAGAHGINVHGGVEALIQNNTVKGGNGSGSGVGVAGAQLDGIHVENNDGVEILANTISAGQGVTITLPFIGTLNFSGGNGANGNGVYVSGSDNAVIDQNIVTGDLLGNGMGAGVDGIHVEDSNNLTVGGLTPLLNGNKIFSTGNDGIYIDGSTGAFVLNNIIGGVPLMNVAGDGIDMQNTTGSIVAANIITDVAGDGIEFSDGSLSLIGLNFITGAGDNGINLDNTALTAIALNQITNAAHNGIVSTNSLLSLIGWNTITSSGYDGINVGNSALTFITANTIDKSGDDGIDVDGALGVLVSNNTVTNSDDNGIELASVLLGSVNGNTVDASGYNGIDLRDSALVSISDNTVTDSDNHGIYVDPSFFVTISGNTVTGAGADGIHADDVFFLDISNNTVSSTGDDGIDVDGTLFALIDGNTVSNATNNGIEVSNAAGVLISGNDVSKTGGNGIDLSNAILAGIVGNTTALTLGDGIHADYVAGLLVAGNTSVFAGDDGIDLNHTVGSIVAGNNVGLVGHDGIHLRNSALSLISGNNIALTGNDGIEVDNSALVGVVGNNVFLTGGDGIDLDRTIGTVVANNQIIGTLGNGIRLDDSALSLIANNDIAGTLRDGVHVTDSALVAITGNDISFNGDDGIDVDDSAYVLISGNDIDYLLDNGIEVSDTNNALISDNNVGLNGYVGGNGVDIRDSSNITVSANDIGTNVAGNGIFVDPSFNITIDGNNINGVGIDGIHAEDVDGLIISNNTVDGSGEDGVEIHNSLNVEVLKNLISNSGFHGLYASGQDNGSIVLKGNTFTNNPVGAEFESGAIDLTGLGLDANTFNGGDVALRFDPTALGDPNKLTLVGDTIGETFFNGQSTYYVELANKAFFDPGQPTVLDGYHATYDGFRPDTVAFLTVAQYVAIENKIQHYRDDPTLGLFFFGNVPEIDQSRLFRELNGFSAAARGLNITIRGLPLIPGLNGGQSALNLANITPAAGGNDNDENVANIEPAAGGDDASNDNSGQKSTCWSDAAAGAGGGTTVNYSFSGTADGALSDAASCQSGSI